MPDTPDWPPLGEVSEAQLTDIRLQVHHAIQALAAFGQAFADEVSDDGHRTAHWSIDDQCFWSRPGKDGTRVALGFHPLELRVVPVGERGSSLRLMGTTHRTFKAWLEKSVSGNADEAADALPWPDHELPEHRILTGVPFEPLPRGEKSLAAWFTRACALLREIVDGRSDASEIRTWPQNLHVSSLLTLEADEDGQPTRTLTVGMSPGGDSYAEPHFYVIPQPAPDPDDLPSFDGPGYWHTLDWVGLVLTAAALGEFRDAAAQREAAESFFQRALDTAQDVLDGLPPEDDQVEVVEVVEVVEDIEVEVVESVDVHQDESRAGRRSPGRARPVKRRTAQERRGRAGQTVRTARRRPTRGRPSRRRPGRTRRGRTRRPGR